MASHPHRRPTLLATVAVALVAACGGNSDGAGQTDPAAVNIEQAWRSYLQGGRTVVVAGNGFNDVTLVENDRFTYTIVYQPRERTTFPLSGASAWKMVRLITATTASTGATVFDQGTRETYFDDNFRLLGHRYFSSGSSFAPLCDAATAAPSLPQAASLFSSGALATTQSYFPCGLNAPTYPSGTAQSWRYILDGDSKLVCWEFVSLDSGGRPESRNEFCQELNADSTFGTKARVTISGPVVPLVLRN